MHMGAGIRCDDMRGSTSLETWGGGERGEMNLVT